MNEFGDEDRASKMGSTTGKKPRQDLTSVNPVLQSRHKAGRNSVMSQTE